MFNKLFDKAVKNKPGSTLFRNNKSLLPEKSSMTVSQWKKDIYFFKNYLLLTHPDLFCRISRDEFNSLFYELESSLQDLYDSEIKLFLARNAASIGDGHTCVPLNFPDDRRLPFSLWWFGEDLRVIDSASGYENLCGLKLLSINNHPVHEIIRLIDRLIPGETRNYVLSQNPYPLTSSFVLSALGIVNNKAIELSFADTKGEQFTMSISPHGNISYKPISLSALLINNTCSESVNWFKYYPESKMLYFRYGRCYDYKQAVRDEISSPLRYPEIVLLCNGIINALYHYDIDRFIIDFRGNSGGYSSLLIKYFLDEVQHIEGWKALNSHQKIFVLIDRDTFSAAVLNCLNLRAHTDAIFVGEPTGGSVNMFAGAKSVRLPYSNLIVNCAAEKLFRAGNSFSSFMPDFIVNQTIEGILSDRDEVLDYVKNL